MVVCNISKGNGQKGTPQHNHRSGRCDESHHLHRFSKHDPQELQVAYHGQVLGTIGPILAKNEELNEEFVDYLNHTISPKDFESKWAAMVQKHDLEGNEHF